MGILVAHDKSSKNEFFLTQPTSTRRVSTIFCLHVYFYIAFLIIFLSFSYHYYYYYYYLSKVISTIATYGFSGGLLIIAILLIKISSLKRQKLALQFWCFSCYVILQTYIHLCIVLQNHLSSLRMCCRLVI